MDHSDTFKAGDLTAVIGDNASSDKHRAGYNGLWSLVHKKESENEWHLNFPNYRRGKAL